MASASEGFPFLYRPMVTAAFGAGLGIVFFNLLSDTGCLIALCLFSVLGFGSWRLGLLPQRTFCLVLVFFLLRCLLLPELTLPDSLLRPFNIMRESLLTITEHLFPREDASLLCAMLWGHNDSLDPLLQAAYRGAGVSHILALSGLHVSFVVMALNRIAGRISLRLRLGLTTILLFAYCAITAFPPSLLRATVMCLCPLAAEALGRKKDQPSSIAFAALFILACTPGALFDIGFQLSFGAVIAIALLHRPITGALHLPRELAENLSISICGLLGTLPLTAYHFEEMALLSLFANLLILPLVPFAFLCSLAVCFLGLVYEPLGFFLAPTARFLLGGMNAAAAAVAELPLSIIPLSQPSILSCGLFYGAMLAFSPYCLLEKPAKTYLGMGLIAAGLFFVL